MAGSFELFVDEDSQIRFRMVMPDGRVLAVSGQYPDKHQAVAAIKDVRECAGTGLISDIAPAAARARESRRVHQIRPLHSARAGSLGSA
jgi:uncharacterized protein